MSFATELKEYRITNNLSQRDLAKKAGISNSMISVYERGKTIPPKETEDRIRALLNMPIFKEEKPKEQPAPPVEPDRFPETKNHEGYSDPTASKAMKNLGPKGVDPAPCEVWVYRRQSDGRAFNKLVLARNGALVTCITILIEDRKSVV